ncbi:hypothetical protein [Aquimarina sp. RZ0]|uniref:hypothetical protein n=1 Tax=Aquimarina sp. RZ0 TaxID=2607730 RepID=UPI0011F1811A|nr:hypothetical protein [Aquimarina sp. RZ0]KAA1244562.1 hypothetical protein F0000_15680 [Aquimarina sp. RZ0]
MNARTIKIITLLLFITQVILGQESNLSIFKNLVGKEWKAEGKWSDGSKFKQETIFTFDLNNTIIIAKSKGFIDKKQSKYGWRNHGIRKFDSKTKTIKFWEFDVFGGLTQGEVIINDKNMFYQYQYGESLVTDMWEYVDDYTYNFKVGNYRDGVWKELYLETQFKAEKNINSGR